LEDEDANVFACEAALTFVEVYDELFLSEG